MASPRRTRARVQIAIALLGGGDANYGYELSKDSGVGPGSMYPFLTELLEAGHLEDHWDAPKPNGKRPRRYYTLTDEGRRFLTDFVSSAPAATLVKAKPRRSRRFGTVRPAVDS